MNSQHPECIHSIIQQPFKEVQYVLKNYYIQTVKLSIINYSYITNYVSTNTIQPMTIEVNRILYEIAVIPGIFLRCL